MVRNLISPSSAPNNLPQAPNTMTMLCHLSHISARTQRSTRTSSTLSTITLINRRRFVTREWKSTFTWERLLARATIWTSLWFFNHTTQGHQSFLSRRMIGSYLRRMSRRLQQAPIMRTKSFKSWKSSQHSAWGNHHEMFLSQNTQLCMENLWRKDYSENHQFNLTFKSNIEFLLGN